MKRTLVVMAVWVVAATVCCLLLVGCAGLVPTDFKKSEAADGAVLTTLVQRHTLNAASVDEAEAWLRFAEISANAELRNRWLNGEDVDLSSGVAPENAKMSLKAVRSAAKVR